MATKKVIPLPSPGDLVFARVTGHPVWPARIQARQGEIFSVFFYGTFDLAKVKAGAIYPYNEQNKAKFANHPAVIKKKVFSQAIEQIEETPEIAPVLDNNKNAIVVVKKPIKKVIQSKTSSSNDLAHKKADVIIEDKDVEEKMEILQESKKKLVSPGNKVFAKWVDGRGVNFFPASVEEIVSESIVKVNFLENKIRMVLTQESDVIPALSLKPGDAIMVNHSHMENYKVTATLVSHPTLDGTDVSFTYKDKFSDEPKTASLMEVSMVNSQASAVLRGHKLVTTTNKVTADIHYENLVLGKRKSLSKGTLSTTSYTEKSDHADATAQTSSKSGRLIKYRKMSQEVVTKNTIEAKSNGHKKHIQICTQETNALNTSHSSKENIVKETDCLKAKGNIQNVKKNCEKTIKLKNNQQEVATVKKFQEKLVESGVSLPKEVVGILDKEVLPKPKEGNVRHKAALTERLKKIAWLKTEQEVVDIDRGIKSSLSKSNPRISCCLEHLGALLVLPLQPLMLLKRPDLVDTLMKIKKYVGPADLTKYSSADKGNIIKGVKKIQKLLAMAFIKLSKLLPEISTGGKKDFLLGFKLQVKKLEESTRDWPEDKVLCMTELPDDY